MLDFFDLLELFPFLPLFLDDASAFEDLEDLEELDFLLDFRSEVRFLSDLSDFDFCDLLADGELLELFSFEDLPPDFVDLAELEPEDLAPVLCWDSEEFLACTKTGSTIKAVDKTSIESKRYIVRMQVLLFF